ncbi:MAG: exonuclease subunit SbcD [Betaproteobacteria bacterium]|nr:exonuclease subunit SbcD [Betaproteobacteria bacterium]
MRLLHTSDWHLGQEFYRHDRAFEHARFLSWLKATILEQKVDVLLISGDLYDTSNPPASAQRLFYNFVREVKEVAKDLVIVAAAGNHDSPARFEIPAELFESFNAHVVGRVTSTAEGLSATENFLIPLHRPGSSKPAAVCLALPYLRAADIYWPGEAISYPEAVTRAYMQGIAQARKIYGAHVPLIALGHMHASGGQVSEESERKLVIGGEEAVALGGVAPEFIYIALGHLHLAQEVGGLNFVRYSGSPLPMSFSEINYRHQVLLVDLEESGEAKIQSLLVPRSVEMLRIPMKAAPLDDVVKALRSLQLPECTLEERPFLEVHVQIEGPTPDMRARIDEALKDVPVRLARIVPSRLAGSVADAAEPQLVGLENLRSIDPVVVFKKIHERDYGTEPAAELTRLFAEVTLEVSGGDEQ